MRFSKKVLTLVETFAFLAGGFIFWRLLQVTGISSLRQAWEAAGPRLSGVFALYPFMSVWETLAWRNLFQVPRPAFLPLFWFRLAGEAVNNVTPVIDIGGEPLKIKWLTGRLSVPLDQATSAIILGKSSSLVSQVFFLWIGMAWSWTVLPWPHGIREAFAIATAVVTGVVFSLLLFQRSNLFGTWSPSTQDFYGRFMPRFAGSTALNLAGWLSGAVELWVFSWILGAPLDWRQALVLESLVQLVRISSFFIPGNIGTQEAGYIFLIQLMGFEPSAGMALSLLKRARQIAWTGVGFGLWGIFRSGRRPVVK